MSFIESKDLKKFSIQAKDGQIGSVFDFYFDEDLFYLRYLVVNTERFLLRNLVLISPICFYKINTIEKLVEINLTKKELEDSPKINSVEVISRQHEKSYHDYFLWPHYWRSENTAWVVGPYGVPWGDYDTTGKTLRSIVEAKSDFKNDEKESSLRSSNEICTYSVKGEGNESFGHVQGFIIDSKTVSIDFIIIDTINFLPSKNVLLRPEWIEDIAWDSKTVKFPFTKEVIKSAPSYKAETFDEEFTAKSDQHFKGILYERKKTFLTVKTGEKLFNIKNKRGNLKTKSTKETVVGDIPSGLFIVTVENSKTHEAEGFLASWIQQASFDPLLVSLCIKDGRPGINEILEKTPFCINVIGENSPDYLNHFSINTGNSVNPLSRIPYKKIKGKGIVLNDAKSVLVCRAHEITHPGDHYLVTAEVIDGLILDRSVNSRTHIREEGTHY